MKKLSFFAAVTVGFMFTSCIKEPVSCLTAGSTAAIVDEEISFANCSEDAETYEWNFGDSSDVVTTATANHAFESEGTFTVTLTAYSKKEKKSTQATTLVTVSKTKEQMFAGTKKDGDQLVWENTQTLTYAYVVNQPIFDQRDTINGNGETIVFMADGTYMQKDASGMTEDSGTWSMSADETTVTITSSDSAQDPITFTIVSLTDSYMELFNKTLVIDLANFKQYSEITVKLQR